MLVLEPVAPSSVNYNHQLKLGVDRHKFITTVGQDTLPKIRVLEHGLLRPNRRLKLT